MENKYFIGMTGGKKENALYFVGKINNRFIYHDPHFIQNSVDINNLSDNINTFKNTNIKSLNQYVIDTSIVICFLV